MKTIKLTPQSIGTDDMNDYIISKFQKLREDKKINNKSKEECIELLSSYIIKPSLKKHSNQGDYTSYEIDNNAQIFFLKSFNNIILEGKLFKHESGKNILSIKTNILLEDLENYIDILHDELLQIYNKELLKFNKE